MEPQVVQADCLEWMREQPDDSVDLVFTSPPYLDCREYGELKFKLGRDEWVEWALERYKHCLRISRGLVAWVVDGPVKNYQYSGLPHLLTADLIRAGYCARRTLIYKRSGIPGSGGPDWFRSDHEYVVCFTEKPGKLPWSDNTACGKPPKWAPGGEMSHRLVNGARVNSKGKKFTGRKPDGRPGKVHSKRHGADETTLQYYVPPKLANPGTVIEGIVGGGHLGSKLAHENEAPFPEWLAERFIKSCCPPEGTVLDPFCGSGTTLAVAIKNGRRAIGVDIRANQVNLTGRRIEEAQGCNDGAESEKCSRTS